MELCVRNFSVGAMLLVFASVGVAGEHYVEVWNPPEARLLKPSATGKAKARNAALFSSHASTAAPRARRVADPLAKLPRTKPVAAQGPKKWATPRATNLPRIITPEGNVLRVKDSATWVHVVR